MKVLAHFLSGEGPLNAIIGLCQTLQERNHEIYLILDSCYAGQLEKYGFYEIILEPDSNLISIQDKEDAELLLVNPTKFHAKKLLTSGFLSKRNSLEKLQILINEQGWLRFETRKLLGEEPQVRQAIHQVKPDLILVDHYFVLPCVLRSGIPWIHVWCHHPNAFYNSTELPPVYSGLSTYDKASWPQFASTVDAFRSLTEKLQNEILFYFDHPPLERSSITLQSPYLNIYGYPAELDYEDVVRMPPKRSIRVDAYVKPSTEMYLFPEDFAANIKDRDKIIYISLGSMGSADIDLMQRILLALTETPHKYVVSKGPLGDEYSLPQTGNMWGENYLPQTRILPLVDLVITHGGNNTITETMCVGKPMIVMPLFADQFDNAQRVQERGFGLRVEPYEFESKQLVDAVNRVLNDQDMKNRAKQAAKRIAESKSKERACQAIELLVNECRRF